MNPIKIGTDASGIEAPIQALLQLNIPHIHEFSSEIDKYCIKTIKANYNPKIIYDNILNRDNYSIPDIDLYVCGFPCQPFSQAGNKKGFKDKRGNIFFSCIDLISIKKPKYFVLENVKGILSNDKGKTWKTILDTINNKLEEEYNIYHKLLNTKDYGIPQNRERVFIIGIRKDLKQNFEWPKKIQYDKLENYINNDNNNYFESKRFNDTKYKNNSIFVDLNFKDCNYVNANEYCPCINTHGGLWCIPKHRYADTSEHLKLQGFPSTFKQVVSDSQLKKQLGNTISVNVLQEIFKQLLL